MKFGFASIAWVLGAAMLAACSGQSAPAARIDPQRISDHIKVLSADAFEGRAPGSAAEPKVIDYLVGQFTRSHSPAMTGEATSTRRVVSPGSATSGAARVEGR